MKMAIPFRLYDRKLMARLDGVGYIWCLRCQDWIPLDIIYFAGSDLHLLDHLKVYKMLRRHERRFDD